MTATTGPFDALGLDEVARLVADLHARSWKSAYRGIFPDAYLDFAVDGDRLRHWLAHVRTLATGEGQVFLAHDGASPLGFLCIEASERGVVRIGKAAYVNNLHVLPHLKGRGIGTALLAAGTRWAEEHGFDSLYLYVYEDNFAARRYYEAAGWHVVERMMAEVPGGTLAAELRMVKPLVEPV